MKVYSKNILILLSVLVGFSALGQSSFNLYKNKSSKIRFQLINNIIVLPVELNGVQLSFVLDTGVSRPILFNLVNTDSLQIKNTEVSYLRGLGSNGSIEALKSKGNILKVGEAISVNTDVSMVFDPSINFTPRLGVSVHGIIGYNIFKDFIVEINYAAQYIRLHKHAYLKEKKLKSWKSIPLEIINNKPYVNARVKLNDTINGIKLLMDTGSSDALWLFENQEKNIRAPKEKYFDDFLGKGLSGPVYGKRSKAESFFIDDYELNDVNVAFPEPIYLTIARNVKTRNGSVSGNILKRFNLFFDYSNQRLWFKKNSKFRSAFYYNNSGITLEQRGLRVVKEVTKKVRTDSYSRNVEDNSVGIDLTESFRYVLKPSFQVVELRVGSNAQLAGVEIGDIIISVNGKQASELSLQEVNNYFHNKKGTPIRLKVERDEREILYRFQLDDVFQKKNPQKEGS